jgi:hypothetical protein
MVFRWNDKKIGFDKYLYEKNYKATTIQGSKDRFQVKTLPQPASFHTIIFLTGTKKKETLYGEIPLHYCAN